MAKTDALVEKVRNIYSSAKTTHRSQWEHINQKGFDFANDNQLSEGEKLSLEEQGMPHGKKYLMYLVKHNIM